MMNTTVTMDETSENTQQGPGASLTEHRILKGYSQEYVASKLHLRVRVIELIEADDYPNMPEPVFIKGYLRAYAKLLEIDHEPLVNSYNTLYGSEKKIDKALWQSRRETNKANKLIHWVTLLFAFGVLVAISVWWHNSKDTSTTFRANTAQSNLLMENSNSEIRLTDLTKMHPLLSDHSDSKQVELNGG